MIQYNLSLLKVKLSACSVADLEIHLIHELIACFFFTHVILFVLTRGFRLKHAYFYHSSR